MHSGFLLVRLESQKKKLIGPLNERSSRKKGRGRIKNVLVVVDDSAWNLSVCVCRMCDVGIKTFLEEWCVGSTEEVGCFKDNRIPTYSYLISGFSDIVKFFLFIRIRFRFLEKWRGRKTPSKCMKAKKRKNKILWKVLKKKTFFKITEL